MTRGYENEPNSGVDLTTLGYANALFGGVVLTHGDSVSFSWGSVSTDHKNTIAETGRIFFDAEQMWLSRWRLERTAYSIGEKTIILLESPDPVLRNEDGSPSPRKHVDVFENMTTELAGVSRLLDSSVPTITRRCPDTKEGTHRLPSYGYRRLP